MQNKKNLYSVITIAILISILATSSIVYGATINNYNPNEGTVTTTSPTYMTSDNSAYAASAEYGNLLNEAYGWENPHGGNIYRTGFNAGPAPDRPDVLFKTSSGLAIPKVFLGSTQATDVVNPFVNTFSSPSPIAMAGQIILWGSIRVNSGNSTARNAVISINPHTGACNWASIIGYGPTTGATSGSSMAGAGYMFKVDDTHFATVSGGLSMFRITGEFLWRDSTVNPNAVYHSILGVGEPVQMVFGPHSVSGQYVPTCSGWTVENPETDMGEGNRKVFDYIMDEPGNPMLSYGDGKLLMGSYSSCSVYAIDIATGDKVWETFVETAMGYMTSFGDGKFFIGTQSMHIYALDSEDGSVIWHNTDGVRNRAFNVWCINYAYGNIYLHDLGFARTGAEKCLDAETGKMLWASTALFSIGYYSTVVADGKVYGNQADGSTTTGREADPTAFACWDAFTGEVLWKVNQAISSPVIAYGCLYFVSSSQLWAMSTAVAPEDFSMWRGSVETPSVVLSKGPSDISTPKWVFTTGAAVISSPVISDGKLYITSCDRNVYCLNAYSGEEIWTFLTNQPKMTTFGSTPAVVNGKVVVGPDDGNLYILDADDGSVLSTVPMGTYRPVEASLGQHNIRSSPVIYNNNIYVGSQHNGMLYCVSLNGQVQWSTVIADGAPILGSVGIADNYIYVMGDDTNFYKLDMNGNIIMNFPISTSGDSFWSGFWGVNSYSPTIDGDRLWPGGTNNKFRCYNITDGSLIYEGTQPNVAGETSHGSLLYVPSTVLTSTVNQTSGATVSGSGGFIISQAGPTVACARADNGLNVWSAWGGWEVWSSPLFAGIGSSAVVYFGSDSYSITALDAATGAPLSWYTTGGNIVGSAAVWDGKLYVGSYDNKVYCFEDHATQEMTISASVDTNAANVDQDITVTATLTGVPQIDDIYSEIGAPAPIPPMPDTEILVTYTNPEDVEAELSAVTDKTGTATVTFTADMAGTWKVIAWYMGEDGPVSSRTYAFSDELTLSVSEGELPSAETLIATVTPATTTLKLGESVVLTASTSGGTAGFTYKWYQIISGTPVVMSGETASTLLVAPTAEGTYGYYVEVTDAAGQVDSTDTAQVKMGTAEAAGIPMEYIYAIIAVIAIVIIVIVAYMLLKKRK
ncbi:MAG: PQQ-binding-like beta-propeller repeat protein [Candidatus Bathyarchaeia archaeon]